MVYQATIITGARTILIIIGVFTLLRWIGRALQVKREMAKTKDMEHQKKVFQMAKKAAEQNEGKVTIERINKNRDHSNTIDIPSEEV